MSYILRSICGSQLKVLSFHPDYLGSLSTESCTWWWFQSGQ